MWVDPRKGSGKQATTGKGYFVRLAENVIRYINQRREKDRFLYARSTIICCNMALNLSEQREERQLFPLLQEII